jgi:phosphate transport system permease protein
MRNLSKWWKSGSPWIWLNAGAVAVSMVTVIALLMLILVRGLGHFWPADIVEVVYQGPSGSQKIIGELIRKEQVDLKNLGTKVSDTNNGERWLLKTGNRELSADFRWIEQANVISVSTPKELVVLERSEWGSFYGYLISVSEKDKLVAKGENAWSEFDQRVERVANLREKIHQLERAEMGAINYQLEKLRLKRKKLELDNTDTPAALEKIQREERRLGKEFDLYMADLRALNKEAERDSAVFQVMGGQEVSISFDQVIEGLRPNNMGYAQKISHYIATFVGFLKDDPREANTEGGVFPAIFGTVVMVMIMSIIVTPFGVIAAVYLREYASQGIVTKIVRIAVNNLAGVPSIVYGVFGLGFFVYFLGGSLDSLFYPEYAPAPYLGTSGLMWASLTLALLTLPVVIVSTEEGLTRIPRNLREGSLALGATKAETLWKVVLPMASPSIMTGLILAVARAAGEVAPLMLVGVVKLAPELPLDGNFPYLHIERKFMHLGFHIYDVGFQSPNVEAAQPLVYATAFLLVLIIVVLNLSAILLRNSLREKYRGVTG